MVSFWPWKKDDSSPASFEKTLSALSGKISTTQAQLDSARSASRRMKFLWTLYLSFAYLVYAIVLFLVVGFKNLGPLEWTGMAGSPALIYGTRAALSTFFAFRIDTLSSRLEKQQTERARAIQKLKDATKYDSTLELLEKYGGGGEGKTTRKGKKGASGDEVFPAQGKKGLAERTPQRTQILPPATANIPRGELPRSTPSASGTPQSGSRGAFGTPQQHLIRPMSPASPLEPSADFAPNAFGPNPGGVPSAANYAPDAGTDNGTHWYDRILDLMLGEDETAARNRIVLICSQCRLVNGQAPPGTRSLAEVGVWKCMACGAANGERTEDESRRIVKEALLQSEEKRGNLAAEDEEQSSDLVDLAAENVESSDGSSEDEKTSPPVRMRRSGMKKGGK